MHGFIDSVICHFINTLISTSCFSSPPYFLLFLFLFSLYISSMLIGSSQNVRSFIPFLSLWSVVYLRFLCTALRINIMQILIRGVMDLHTNTLVHMESCKLSDRSLTYSSFQVSISW